MIPKEIYRVSLTMDRQWETYRTEFKNMDISIDQMFEAFTGMLIASGWSQGHIDDYMLQKAEELKEESI